MEITLLIIVLLAFVLDKALEKRSMKKRHARCRRLTYASASKEARVIIPFSEVARHAMLKASQANAAKAKAE